MPKKNKSNKIMISSPIILSSILEEINLNLPIFEAKEFKDEYEESLLSVMKIIQKSSTSDKAIFQFIVMYQEIKKLIAENERTNSNEEARMKKFTNLEGRINPIQDQQSERISITTIQGLKNTDEHDQAIENQINPKDNKGSVYLNGFTLKAWKTLSETSNKNSLYSESNGSKSDKDEENQHQSLEQIIREVNLIRSDLESLCLSNNISSSNPVKKRLNTFGNEINLTNNRNNLFTNEIVAPKDAPSIVCASYKKSCL